MTMTDDLVKCVHMHTRGLDLQRLHNTNRV